MKKNTIKSIKYLNNNEIKKSIEDIPNYLKKLDEKQQIVATAINGNFLVVAGPGAGKTHTMVYRIVHMIKMGVNPKEICMITFTRKAAKEMNDRINNILPGIQLGFVGTFHALANYLISKTTSPHRKRFRLIDSQDDLEILKLVKEVYGINFKNNIRMKTIQKILSYRYNVICSIEKSIIVKGYEEYIADLENISQIERKYIKYKSSRNLLTYDDILLELLKRNDLINPFKYLVVDEYQDTNNLQIQFIKKLGTPNVMAIGDDLQSIYSFRGSNNEIILNFANDFQNSKLIKLDKNYRSTKNIVNVINKIANSSLYKFEKKLETTNGIGEKVEVIPVANIDFKEFIINKIHTFPNQSHAMIYRTNNEKKYLEPTLIKFKIPYSVYGGIKLLERKHIKDILSVLLTNMSKSDEISFLRALKMCRGVGEVTAQKMIKNYPNVCSIKKTEQIVEIISFIENENLSLEELLGSIIKWYMANDEILTKSNYNKEEIIDDFDLIQNLAKGYKDKYNFINDLILNPVHDFNSGTQQEKVVLTTIHSCKGLEFDNVYHVHQLMFFRTYSTEELEESRRLFYVANSRSKKRLFILDQKDYKRNIDEILLDFSNEGYSNKVINLQNTYNVEFNEELEKKFTQMENDSKVNRVGQENKKNSINTKYNNEGNLKKLKYKNRKTAILLACLSFVGIGGMNKIYEGKYILGIIYFLTMGLFWIGAIIDIISLIKKDEIYHV